MPRRRIGECFGIARSTLYRWLHNLTDRPRQPRKPWNKTPTDIAALAWEVARSNWNWGRVRIANRLRLLGNHLHNGTAAPAAVIKTSFT